MRSAHPFFNFRDRLKIYAAQNLTPESPQEVDVRECGKLLEVRLQS